MPPVKKAAAKKAAPAKSAVQATITLKHLAAALADSHEIAKKQAEAVLGDLVMLITRHLKKGDKIRLTGLGILQVRKHAARMGESGYGRDHQDKGQQEGRIPACQGTEGSGVAVARPICPLRRQPIALWSQDEHSRAVHRRTPTRTTNGKCLFGDQQHLKHEFRTLGRDASGSVLAAAVGSEIDRLSKEAETLRKLRAVLFGVV